MCMHILKTVYACGCAIADSKPGDWCLLGDQCSKVDHQHVNTKHVKETCANCLKTKEQKKEENDFLQQDGFTVVANTKNVRQTDTTVKPKRSYSWTHSQGVDLAEIAAKNLNDLLQKNWIVGQKNRSLFEYILGLPRFIPRPRLIEIWVWWAVGREPYSRLRSARAMAAHRDFGKNFDVSMEKAQKELQEEMEAKRADEKS
ncbi:hypothetical protein PG991_013832 [Apiospora marii]|uniref:Uncharacterized protein n=1 Tax=Apiospora marii TaxID=335849 RepID=A0ABR1R740_9PEZI